MVAGKFQALRHFRQSHEIKKRGLQCLPLPFGRGEGLRVRGKGGAMMKAQELSSERTSKARALVSKSRFCPSPRPSPLPKERGRILRHRSTSFRHRFADRLKIAKNHIPSELKRELCVERPVTRRLAMKVDGAELIILVGQIQDADGDRRAAFGKAIATHHIGLPEIIAVRRS